MEGQKDGRIEGQKDGRMNGQTLIPATAAVPKMNVSVCLCHYDLVVKTTGHNQVLVKVAD